MLTSGISSTYWCHSGMPPMAHLFVQLMINVVIPTTTSMTITSAKQGYNISLMVTISPSIMKQQSNMAIKSAKQKHKLQT